jgi:hypothetical protein
MTDARLVKILAALSSLGHAVEPGKPSRTAVITLQLRAVGAKLPEPELRNPDNLAERFVGVRERAILTEMPLGRVYVDMDSASAWREMPEIHRSVLLHVRGVRRSEASRHPGRGLRQPRLSFAEPAAEHNRLRIGLSAHAGVQEAAGTGSDRRNASQRCLRIGTSKRFAAGIVTRFSKPPTRDLPKWASRTSSDFRRFSARVGGAARSGGSGRPHSLGSDRAISDATERNQTGR